MNKIKIFENPEFGSIRTLQKDGEPWFVGKDVAEVLGYSNASKAVLTHSRTLSNWLVIISCFVWIPGIDIFIIRSKSIFIFLKVFCWNHNYT